MEAIILAGGLGTRLRGVIGDYPKCMATVAQRPFLFYLHRYLQQQGVKRIIHALGYRHDVVEQYLQEQPLTGVQLDVVVEKTPLGTGGGIQLALQQAQEANVLVLNGDTFFDVPLTAFLAKHHHAKATVSLALKPMTHFDRYGTVTLQASDKVQAFEEKKPMSQGLINGGVYCIRTQEFLATPLPEKFSFEQDYLPTLLPAQQLSGFSYDGYFIDIGIPEDYARAQEHFAS